MSDEPLIPLGDSPADVELLRWCTVPCDDLDAQPLSDRLLMLEDMIKELRAKCLKDIKAGRSISGFAFWKETSDGGLV